MKFIWQLSNQEKIMLSFLVLLVLLNGIIILVSRNLSGLSYSFRSMLEDRLIPAADLSNIQEEMYTNRFLVEKMMYMYDAEAPELVGQIQRNNQDIDQTIMKYAKTYLTTDETSALEKFKEQIQVYQQLEKQVINLLKEHQTDAAEQLYLNQSLQAFENLQRTMHILREIQVEVGKNLYHDARHLVSIIQFVGYLSIAIALVTTVNLLKILRIRFK